MSLPPANFPRFPIALTLALTLGTVRGAEDTPADPSRSPGAGAAAVFPLKTSANGRYLVDNRDQPFLIVGDTGWSLIAQVDEAGVNRYLGDRARRGFNATILNLLEHKFCSHAPANRAGVAPFRIAGDFSTPNDAYFDFAHTVVKQALDLGICVWLAPAYLGFGGGDEGFFREIKAGGIEKLRDYGRFVGRRFRDLPNIIWMIGGDFTPPQADLWSINALARAIAEEDSVHLMTVHPAPETFVPSIFGKEPWLKVSTVYSYKPELFQPFLLEYSARPPRPYVLIETTYEGEHNSTPDQIRRQAYWAMLGGACGQFFGNNPIWHFDGPGLFPTTNTWEQALDAPGSKDMAHLRELFHSLPWQLLEPEQNHQIITEGYGQGLGTTLTSRTPDGGWSVSYCPSTAGTPRELTVDTATCAGPLVARWFNPVDGHFTPASPALLAKPGVHRLRSPGDNGTHANDWVLVLHAGER